MDLESTTERKQTSDDAPATVAARAEPGEHDQANRFDRHVTADCNSSKRNRRMTNLPGHLPSKQGVAGSSPAGIANIIN
jgi:hypothetical protein